MRTRLPIPAAALLAAATVCAGEPRRVAPPERLSETGLYAERDASSVDPANLAYIPQYPLWSDGAAKSRWIYLPPGTAIDISDVSAWRFPVGTKLWKEFAFEGRKIETRMLWHKNADEWIFVSYVWNDAQTDATRAPESGIKDLVPIAPGKFHSIPGVSDCKSCHESGRSPVLGFNALQLSDDRDPLAIHGEPLRPGMTTLSRLVAAGRLDPPRPDLAAVPPRIQASSPRERAVLGYFAGNCGHCHNAAGPLARVGLVLAHDPALPARVATDAVLSTLLDASGRFQVPGAAEGSSRLVAAGAPDRSALLYRLRSRRPASQMPPLGSVLPDVDAVRMVESWIAEDLAPAHGD